MLISIIANFYKSEKYIPKLLKSVAQQTFSDWELICVVDASPGRDVEVIKKWCERLNISHKCRIIINPENIGISRSKKVGIDAAKGEYLAFIDGDDFFAPRALEVMAEPAIKYNVDFVNINFCRYYAPLKKKVVYRPPIKPDDYGRVMQKDEFFDIAFVHFFGWLYIGFLSYWAKLYKAHILKDLNFAFPDKANAVCEDKWMNIEAFQHINSAYFVDYMGYYWRWGGLSCSFKDNNWNHVTNFEKHLTNFPYQVSLIEKYSYDKARLPLIRTLLSKFIEAYAPLAAKNAPDSEKGKAIKNEISGWITQDPMLCINEICEDANTDSLAALKEAIMHGDVDSTYDELRRFYKKGWKIRFAQDVFRLIFNPIR